jgi:uncharacterized damage-inducible protein DinB
MANKPLPEVWLRGPVPGVPPLLQPVAHGLLQCREELHAHVGSLTPEQLWARPSGAASIGFHVRHAAGSLDRLFTYARGEALSAEQLVALRAEEKPDLAPDAARTLLSAFDFSVEHAIGQLHNTSEATLLEPRGVGRAQLPSTTMGLLFHAAEHTHRHVGQVVTTARVVTQRKEELPRESGDDSHARRTAVMPESVARTEIVEADLTRRDHQDAVKALIAAYASDPMGNSGPLSADVMDRLIPGLQRHPTTLILLAYVDGEPAGIATCFVGFSTTWPSCLRSAAGESAVSSWRGSSRRGSSSVAAR